MRSAQLRTIAVAMSMWAAARAPAAVPAPSGLALLAPEGEAGWVVRERGATTMLVIETPLLATAEEIETALVRQRTHWSLTTGRSMTCWLELKLGAEARGRMEAAGPALPGRRLALVVRGEVLHRIVLTTPLAGRMVELHGFRDRESAESVAQALHSVMRPAGR